MNLFSLATDGVDLDALPLEQSQQPRASFKFAEASGPARLRLPRELDDVFGFAANEYGVDVDVLRGIAYAESRFNPDIISGKVKSPAGAIGLMQFMPDTAKEYGIDPTDPVQAIMGGAAYLRKSLDKFDGDYERAVASYNWGPNRKAYDSEDWASKAPQETQKYLMTVFGAVGKFKDGASEQPAANKEPMQATPLPAGVAPSTAGGGRGSVSPGMVNTKLTRTAVPDMTVGSVAQDIGSGLLQVGPTAVKGVGELVRLATGDRLGQGITDFAERGIQATQDIVGSGRAAAQRQNLAADMADDSVSLGQAIASNKGALADQILPTLGSMAIPLGAAGVAGKAATVGRAAQGMSKAAMAARVASVQQAAGIGATAAQNAASTFAEMVDKGVSMPDAYKAAGITVPFSLIAGKLTGGGAEGALIKGLSGQSVARGAVELAKAPLREGAQEGGESLGQVAGEVLGAGQDVSLQSGIKRVGTEALLGAVVGGGMGAVQQIAAPRVESQPTTPQAPPVAPAAPAQSGTPPVAPTPPAAQGTADAIMELERRLQAAANPTAQPTADAGTTPVAPTGNAGATEGAGGTVAAVADGQPEQAQALSVPENFTATPAATVGTQTSVQAGPGFTGKGIAAEMAALRARSQPTNSLSRTSSWVIKEKATGNVILETFDKTKVDALNTAKYEAVPIQQHLASLSQPAPVATQPATQQAEQPRTTKAAQPAKANLDPQGLLSDDERQMLGEFTRLYQTDLKADIRQRLGMTPKEQATAQVEKKKPSALLSLIVQMGGIKSGLSADLTGANAMEGNRRHPGLFRNNGKQLDVLVQSLKEHGYLTQADEDSILDNGGTNKLADMIQAELSGERAKLVDNTDGFEAMRDADMRPGMEDKATALGLSQDMVNSMSDSRLNGTIKRIEARLGHPIKTDFATRKMSRAEARAEREAILMADRYERARAKYDAELQAFAEADDMVQDAVLDVVVDEDGNVEIVYARAVEVAAASDALNGTWSDQNAEVDTRRVGAGQENSGQAGPPVASTAEAGAGNPEANRSEASAGSQETLTTYTPEEVTAQQEAAEKAERTAKAKKQADDLSAKKEQERKEIAQASVAAADTFELGGDAMANLTGQNDLQFSRAAAKEVRDLVTLHNLSEDNLMYAGKMGGIPVPSIGITKVETPFGGFGGITLIAPKDLIDPEAGVPVYDRDAWTARFPELNFKKIKAKVADAFYERMSSARDLGGDGGQFMSSLFDELRNARVQSPDKITSLFTRYSAPKMLYAQEALGKAIKPQMRSIKPETPFGHTKAWRDFVAKSDTRNMTEQREREFNREAAVAAMAAMVELGEARKEGVDDRKTRMLDSSLKSYLDRYITEDGMNAGILDRALRDVKSFGQKEIDPMKMDEAVRKVVPLDDAGYKEWVADLVEPLFEAPTITVRGSEVPVTLENVVEAMTIGKTAGAEKSMTFGVGKAASMLGKQFKSIDEIKAARNQVVSASSEKEGKKSTEALISEYQNHVSAFYTGKDWKGNIDTWAALDSSLEALTKAGRIPTDGTMNIALQRSGFKRVDAKGISLAKQALEALRDATTDYFEAKPQRAVRLNEFKGAVIPKGTSAEAIALLEENGITVEVHGNAEGAREKAIQKLAKKLDGKTGNVIFSRDTESPRTPAATIRAAITKAYGNLLDKLEAKGLVTIAQTEREAIEAAAQARADKTGGDVDQIKRQMLASVQMQRVWHGSPHRGIQQFSTEKIGTGEGAQAFGWGLYYASKREIAESYRGTLTYRDMVRKFRNAMPDDASIEDASEWADSGDAPKDMARVIKALSADDWLGFDYPAQALTALFKEPANFDISKELADAAKAMQGQLYEVEIPEDGDMLLWDKPLSEQPENVRKALANAKSLEGSADIGMEAADMLRNLSQRDAGTEQAFSKLDIPSKRLVLSGVRNVLNNLKVRQSVVGLVPVDVVDILAGKQLSSKALLDNPSMLLDLLPANGNDAVSMNIDRADAAIRAIALAARTEGLLVQANPVRVPENLVAAVRAGKLDQVHGYQIYRMAERELGSAQDASEFLKNVKVAGIKYLDGTSRSAGDGSFNYVVFDGSDTQIVDVKYSANGNIEGFFDKQTGKSFLVADNLTAASAPGTLMHEVGIHMAADGKLEPLFNRAAQLLKLNKNNPFLQRVQARMARAGETSDEEAAAYIVTEYENDRANAPASVAQWVKDFIADVRAWLFNKGVLLKADQLTVADIAAVARANARSMARGGPNGGPGGGIRLSFAGEGAATADKMALATARQRVEAGENAETVRKDTGWFNGVDGKWRFEINDSDASIKDRSKWTAKIDGLKSMRDAALRRKFEAEEKRNAFLRSRGESPSRISSETKREPEFKALVKALNTAELAVEKSRSNVFMAEQDGGLIKVGDVLDHLALFSAYPKISETRVAIDNGLQKGNAAYSPESNTITIPGMDDSKQLLTVLLHEIQHGIQNIEGFATGGSPDLNGGFSAYKRLAGEVESRNTEARQGMTDAQRRAIPPSQTADTPDSDVIVVFNGKDAMSAPAPANADPDIRRSISNRAQQPLFNQTPAHTWEELGESRVDKQLYDWQDDRIDLKRVQESITKAGRQIDDQFDARTAETLLPGRLAKRTEDFMAVEAAPLLKDMAKNNVTMEEVSDYMLARHAPERNAQIAKVNPDMPDAGSGTNSEGVLMTTQAANDHIAALTTGKRMVLEMLARRVDAITKGTRDLLVAEGLEKAETIRAWEGAYKHYVPLFRDEAANTPGHPVGSGISVTGSASKRATGSSKEVTNMLAHVLMQREAAITRAEKNRVGMSLYGMALSHPNKAFWSTVQPKMSTADIVAELQRMGVDPMDGIMGMDAAPTIRTVDDRTGLVVDRPNPMYKKLDNAIVVKVNGEDRVILFNTKNERAMRMAESLKNQHFDQGMWVNAANTVAPVTRFMSAMMTQYNPAFGMVNAVRDIQGALVNLTSTPLNGKQARVLADTPAAVIGIARDIRGDGKRTPWSDLWVQFQEDGGRTGYRDLVVSPYERAANMEKDIKRMQQEGKWTPGNAAHAVLDLLGDFNDSLENGVRLAAYKAALDKGMTRPQAAKLARELTVDFNRKGRKGREFGKLYAFLNASIQGNARNIATVMGAHGGKVLAGGFALGVLQALMLAAAGYEDDEIREFQKARALIIPIGGKQHITIPMALGFHVIPNTSRILTELMLTGGKDWQTKVPEAMFEIANAANPFGGGGDWKTAHGPLTMVMPTAGDWAVDLAMNRDFTGNQISRTRYNERNPGSAIARESTLRTPSGQVYQGISKAINDLTGGSDRKAGAVSPTPEELRYIMGVVGGGVYRETEKAINAAVMLVNGDEIKATQVPLGSRFMSEVRDEDVQRSRYYKNSRTLEGLEADLKDAAKDRDSAKMNELRQDKLTNAIGLNNAVQRHITQINKMAKDDIGDKAAMAQHDANRAAAMRRLNDEVLKLEKQAQ